MPTYPLYFHTTCSRLEAIADGREPEPVNPSDTDTSADESDFWDIPYRPSPSRHNTSAAGTDDEMESVDRPHRTEEPPTQVHIRPRRHEQADDPPPGVNLKKMTDTDGHEVFVEEFPCPHAGQPIRQMDITKQKRRTYPDVGALADPEVFEIAEVLMQAGISGRSRTRFLRMKRIRSKMPWHNNRAMLKDVDKLPHGPDWEVEPFKLIGNCGEEIVELWKQNPLDVIKAMLRDKTLRKYLHYTPQRHYTSRDGKNRRRGELWTGDWLGALQQLIQDEYATIIPCIVSSDETRLTNFAGDKKAHPVYLTIGNLPKRLRRRISKRTSILIGYLPVPKLSCETNKDKRRAIKRDIFHQCMASILAPLAETCKAGGVETLCSDGGIRRIYPVLASYVADFPEQCKVACTKQTHCPLCTTHPKTRGDPGDSAMRDRDDELMTMEEYKRGPSARFNWLGLNNTDPFWAEHEYVDVGTLLTPDLLHQVHKGVMKDHLIKWVTTIVGKAILDQRYVSMPEFHGMRHFKHGITEISQWTGRKLKEMTKILLPAISDSNQRVVQAARALLDFMYLAHLGSITDDEIEAMEEALRTFHDHKDVFEELGTVATDKGFHGIPKIHMIWHYMHLIRELGTPDGYNTETSERLHIDFAKLGYRASNKVNATKQMALYIQRLEAIEMHATYLTETSEPEFWVPGLSTPAQRPQVNNDGGSEQANRRLVDPEDDEDWDAWYEEDEDEDEDDELDELTTAGVRVKPMVDVVVGDPVDKRRANPWEEKAQPPEAGPGRSSPTFYPNPEHVLAKVPTTSATTSYIVREHGAQQLLPAVHSFVRKTAPEHRNHQLDNDTVFNIWTRARLFHDRPPYQPSEGPHIDVIRAQPAKIDQYGRISRPPRFDTALLPAFPDRHGIQRYRPARVRLVFQLPPPLRNTIPEPLAYVELFNSASAAPVPNVGLFTTTRSLFEGQRAALVVRLSTIRMGCHLAPKYSTQINQAPLTVKTDSLVDFKTFYINVFASHFMYGLARHWGQDGRHHRNDDSDEEMAG